MERKAVKTWAARRRYQNALNSSLKDEEIDEALVACANGSFVRGVQPHLGPPLLAAQMDRWPSLSFFGSRKLPGFHRCTVMPLPVWEAIAAQLSIVEHPLMAASVMESVVTYMRLSELLANKEKRPHREVGCTSMCRNESSTHSMDRT